jgi:HlyD family secretion protein
MDRSSCVRAKGFLDAHILDISSKTLGTLTRSYVGEGDSLNENQILFQIDDRILLAKKEQMEARLQFVKNDCDQKNAGVEMAMQEYLHARRDYERQLITSNEMDHKLQLLEEAQNAKQSADWKTIHLESEIRLLEMEIENTRIASPCKGIVVKTWKLPGSVVRPCDPVFTLCDLEHLWIEAEIDENEIDKVHIGALAKIKFSAYPDEVLKGSVSYICPAILQKKEKENQKIPVKISLLDLKHSKHILRPGMSAEIKIFIR